MRLLRKVAIVLTLALVTGTACSDHEQISAPPPVEDAELLRGLVGGLVGTVSDIVSSLLPAVTRLVPLHSTVVVEETVGWQGGVVRGGGVTLTIPRGALRSPTRIKMVVPSGSYVEAEFYPHGLRFQKPVSLEFDMRGTAASGSSNVVGTYFTLPILRGLIQPAETFEATVNNGRVEFQIEHFSKYAPAWKRGYTAAGN